MVSNSTADIVFKSFFLGIKKVTFVCPKIVKDILGPTNIGIHNNLAISLVLIYIKSLRNILDLKNFIILFT